MTAPDVPPAGPDLPGRGRTALVTGASSGIGAATTRQLAAQGWQVVATARRADRLEALAAEHPGVRALALDVTDEAACAALREQVPHLDLLVANAGGALGHGPVGEADVDRWARTFDVNVLGTVRVLQALLPALTAARGHVVLTGSTAGRWVYADGAPYTTAKHALVALRETLRLETVATGLRVSEVAPGMVHTEEFSLVRFDGDAAKAAAVYAGVDALTAQDVADVVCWVASRPAHVTIDLVQLTPQQQAGVSTVVRRA